MAQRSGSLLTVLTVLVGVVVIAAGSSTAAAAPSVDLPACDGVTISAQPPAIIGLGGLILDPGPLVGNLTKCVPVDLGLDLAALRAPAGAAASCKNARKPGHKLRPSLASKAVRCLINAERSGGALAARKQLKRAAKKHSSMMVGSGCFAHRCSGEPDLTGRVTQSGYLPCNCGWKLGENIAYGPRKKGSPAAIVAAWMSSPPHRANILDRSFRDIDVGVRRGRPGREQSSAATFTADFGRKG